MRRGLGWAAVAGHAGAPVAANILIGTLEVGKQADVLLSRTDTPNLAPMRDPVGAVVHAAGTHNVDSVYVAGRPVKRAGTFVDIDLRSVIAHATASHDFLLGEAGVAGRDWCRPSSTPDSGA